MAFIFFCFFLLSEALRRAITAFFTRYLGTSFSKWRGEGRKEGSWGSIFLWEIASGVRSNIEFC